MNQGTVIDLMTFILDLSYYKGDSIQMGDTKWWIGDRCLMSYSYYNRAPIHYDICKFNITPEDSQFRIMAKYIVESQNFQTEKISFSHIPYEVIEKTSSWE